jgi:hypothetical protein
MAEFRAARSEPASASVDAAWRDVETAGGSRPGSGLDEPPGPEASDEQLRQQAVEAQLAYLKKKFGKQR